jgi:probable HAF family extracellular repeat protein
MKSTAGCLLIAFVGVSAASNAAPPAYAVTDLGLAQEVVGFNDLGEVLAYDESGRVSVFWKGGYTRDLNLLPTLLTTCQFTAADSPVLLSAGGMNDRGAVVLTAQPNHDPFSNCVVVYERNALQYQQTLGEGGQATGINNAGQIIGQLTDEPAVIGFGPACDFIRSGNFISADAINDGAQIVGNGSAGAELCSNAVWQVIPAVPGATFLFGRAINNKGQVVGDSNVAGGPHAFLYSRGATRDLGTLPGGTYTSAESINARSQVVGVSGTATGSTDFIYEDGNMYDLAALVSATDPYKSFVLEGLGVPHINDLGVIATTGPYASGASHVYILTPIR